MYVSEVVGILNFSKINFVKHILIVFHFLQHKNFEWSILKFFQPVATSQNQVAKEGKKIATFAINRNIWTHYDYVFTLHVQKSYPITEGAA